MEQAIKKPFYRKWWIWVIAVLVLFYFIGSAGNPSSSQPSASTENGQAVQETAGQKQYVEIMKFNGNGQKKSEPFTITGSRFKIAYDCKGDTSATYCGAFVFKVGSVLPQGVMNSPKPVKDETIIYGSGEYYIDANTMGDFTMTVYDYR